MTILSTSLFIIDQSRNAKKKLVYNGGMSNFSTLIFIENRMDVAQILQVISYEVCSKNYVPQHHRIRIIYSSFWDIHHCTPAACCYSTMTSEICL